MRKVLLLALGAILIAGAAEARECQVARLEGQTVRVWHEGTWSPLGDRLPAGAAKIETGRETRVEIRCDDGVVVTVGIATEVNLEVLTGPQAGAAEAVLQLIRGIVGVVAPAVSGFDVRTPLAIASVRSTEWLVEHGADEGSAVFVRAGRVGVRTPGGRVALGPGEGITVPPSGEAEPVKVWGAPRIERSGQALGFGWR
ncbi:MAG TPA: FecR domain-containing protein [Thermohalobaculum sp.]|nr:FecR domain-containing protein [Thermohalobaculum sp.]